MNKDYKIRFDTNSNGDLNWFYPEKNVIKLKPGEVHTVKFYVKMTQMIIQQAQLLLMFHHLHSVYI